MSIQAKLLEFQSKVDAVKKDAKNPFFKSNYVDINGIIKAITPTLKECGISYSQSPDIQDGVDVLVTEIYDADKPDSKIRSVMRLIMTKQDMQQLGSAVTYARRYQLVSLLGLEAEDDDGNYASGKTGLKSKGESYGSNKSTTKDSEW